MGKKKRGKKKSSAPVSKPQKIGDGDLFGDTDGIFGEVTESREAKVAKLKNAVENVKAPEPNVEEGETGLLQDTDTGQPKPETLDDDNARPSEDTSDRVGFLQDPDAGPPPLDDGGSGDDDDEDDSFGFGDSMNPPVEVDNSAPDSYSEEPKEANIEPELVPAVEREPEPEPEPEAEAMAEEPPLDADVESKVEEPEHEPEPEPEAEAMAEEPPVDADVESKVEEPELEPESEAEATAAKPELDVTVEPTAKEQKPEPEPEASVELEHEAEAESVVGESMQGWTKEQHKAAKVIQTVVKSYLAVQKTKELLKAAADKPTADSGSTKQGDDDDEVLFALAEKELREKYASGELHFEGGDPEINNLFLDVAAELNSDTASKTDGTDEYVVVSSEEEVNGVKDTEKNIVGNEAVMVQLSDAAEMAEATHGSSTDEAAHGASTGLLQSFVSEESKASIDALRRELDEANLLLASAKKSKSAADVELKELKYELASTKVSMRTFRDESESKAALLESSLEEVKRVQNAMDELRSIAQSDAKSAQNERNGLKAETSELLDEVARLRKLFDGKELEVRDANAMVMDLTSRAVSAEEQVKEILKVNDDLVKQLKDLQKERENDKIVADKALIEREEQLVTQEKQLEALESKLAAATDSILAMSREYDEYKVETAGNSAALQARLDRHSAELQKERELRELDDTEKQEMRTAMAATQAHAVQVQKAAIAFEERAKADLGRMEIAATVRTKEFEETSAKYTEASAQLADVKKQLASSDNRIRELLGGNPSDPRTEIIRLRMQICTFDGERDRFQAKEMDYKAQLEGLSKALKFATSQQAKLQEQLSKIVDKSGQVAVAENMAKLLEEEAATLRGRISKEVTARTEAEQTLGTLQIDHKHLKTRMEELEGKLADAEARGSMMGVASYSSSSSMGQIGGSTSASTTYTGFGGIEYFNPASYGSAGGSAGATNSSYGGYSSTAPGAASTGYGGMASSMSEIDLMRDLKLSEDRAKAAEKREKILMEKLHNIELDSAMQSQNKMTGYVGIDVHTRLLDMADQRTRDAERTLRDLETENLSLKSQRRAVKGLHYMSGDESSVKELLEKIDNCIIGVKRIHHEGGGSVLSDAEFAAKAARDEREWRKRMAQKEELKAAAEESLRATVEQEIIRQQAAGIVIPAKLNVQPSPATKKKAAPPASPRKPKTKTSADDAKSVPEPVPEPVKADVATDVPSTSVAAKAAAFTAPQEVVKSDSPPQKRPAPKKLRGSLTNLISGNLPMQAGGSPLDVMKAAKRRAAEHDDDSHLTNDDKGDDSDAEQINEGDALESQVQRAPSLTSQFARPKIQRGKRLPSRKGKAEDNVDEGLLQQEVEDSTGKQEAVKSPSKPSIAAMIPLPVRASSDDGPDNDNDWSDEGEKEEAPPNKKLMERMARLAGAGGASPMVPKIGLPVPPISVGAAAVTNESDDDWDDGDDNQDETENKSAKAALVARMAKLAQAGSPRAARKTAPVSSLPPPDSETKKAPTLQPEKSPVVKKKETANKLEPPVDIPKRSPVKESNSPQVKKKPPPTIKKQPKIEKTAPVEEEPKPAPVETKAPPPTNLFAAKDTDDDLLFGDKPKAATSKKKAIKATSLFDLDDDSDDDWMK